MLPALPLETNVHFIGSQANEALSTALEPQFRISEEPHVPTQGMLAASNIPFDARHTGPVVSDLNSVSTLQDGVEMDPIIGTTRLRGSIRCQYLGCTSTFGRRTELRRHHRTLHAVQRPEFWCSEPSCGRSEGGRPFHRSDKMREHERKKHHGGI